MKVRVKVKSLSHVRLCDPMDCSLPGSSIHRIFQAGVLEWVATAFSRDLPDPGIEPRSPVLQANFVLPESQGFPHISVGKESACNAGDPGLIPGLGRSS